MKMCTMLELEWVCMEWERKEILQSEYLLTIL